VRLWLAAAATLLAGCGRLGYEPLSNEGSEVDGGPNTNLGQVDASDPDAALAPDAAVADAAPLGPFRPPELIAELAAPGVNDDDPTLTGDLLELYFKSDRAGSLDYDIWRSVRPTPEDAWGPAERVEELCSAAYDASPEVSFDGLVLYFSSSRAGGVGGVDLYVSTRASRSEAWGAPSLVAELSSTGDEWAPAASADHTSIVITRSTEGRSLDLFGAWRASADQPWSAPVPLDSFASEVYEADAHLDAPGTSMLFAAELPGGDGRDIYRAERGSPVDPFGAPERLDEVSSPEIDEDPWLSPDGRVLVFSSTRTGDQELYWTVR
jgi:hypothetical protein